MASVNKVILLGTLGRDPETRYLPSGNSVCNISIATSEKWKDKNTGQSQEKTTWHSVVFFGKLAEVAGQYLKKGSSVYVEGRLQTNEYEKNGEKRYQTQVVANEMQMLGDKKPAQDQQKSKPQKQAEPDFSDDIPFN